jgi:hypothetical protein
MNFASLSHEQCQQYLSRIEKRWKMDRCKAYLDFSMLHRLMLFIKEFEH